MALYLASVVADDTAKAIQLAVEYDPQPPSPPVTPQKPVPN
ncbi:hypothetical protein SMA5143A_7544 [Streptomyces sp. MA5143a]|nr:hypothetical protein SMA5143A_7544 [Streptomyces sp. MA5143a]